MQVLSAPSNLPAHVAQHAPQSRSRAQAEDTNAAADAGAFFSLQRILLLCPRLLPRLLCCCSLLCCPFTRQQTSPSAYLLWDKPLMAQAAQRGLQLAVAWALLHKSLQTKAGQVPGFAKKRGTVAHA